MHTSLYELWKKIHLTISPLAYQLKKVMKTIKDLRELIKLNNGEIKIGNLLIRCQEDEDVREDIDFYFNDHLAQWIGLGETDDKILSELDLNMDSYFKDNSEEKKELKGQVEELKDELLKNGDSKLIKGKVEAYEKLLIGRDVTIGK